MVQPGQDSEGFNVGDTVRLHNAIGFPESMTGTIIERDATSPDWWRVQLDGDDWSIFGSHEIERVVTEDTTDDSTDQL